MQVFEALWGTNELLSSFDSINILKPGQHESSTDGWLHVDQAPLRKGVTCIQGLLNMVDVGPETGETYCWLSSFRMDCVSWHPASGVAIAMLPASEVGVGLSMLLSINALC